MEDEDLKDNLCKIRFKCLSAAYKECVYYKLSVKNEQFEIASMKMQIIIV